MTASTVDYKLVEAGATYGKTGSATRMNELNMTGDCILTNSRLEPNLSKFIASLARHKITCKNLKT